MYFLVILIALTVNYVWLKDFDRFSDAWFFEFRGQVEKQTSGLALKSAHGWLIGVLILYAIPLLAVGIVLLALEDVFFGIFAMFVHILVLLVVFDRTQPGKLAADFLAHWKQDDAAACSRFLREEMIADSANQEGASCETLAEQFKKLLAYRFFEKMFVVFFWYMVTGPLGVVFCYVTYQLRDSNSQDSPEPLLASNQLVIRILEWIPIRLAMLSFSLAGNFVKCFSRLQQFFWEFSLQTNYADVLYEHAESALHGMHDGTVESAENPRAAVAREIEALQGLLERSQLIWLSVLALITVFGINA